MFVPSPVIRRSDRERLGSKNRVPALYGLGLPAGVPGVNLKIPAIRAWTPPVPPRQFLLTG